ncbi:MAG: hypothetical protein WC483_00295 [Candidatus Paceibacterota bacterium]
MDPTTGKWDFRGEEIHYVLDHDYGVIDMVAMTLVVKERSEKDYGLTRTFHAFASEVAHVVEGYKWVYETYKEPSFKDLIIKDFFLAFRDSLYIGGRDESKSVDKASFHDPAWGLAMMDTDRRLGLGLFSPF